MQHSQYHVYHDGITQPGPIGSDQQCKNSVSYGASHGSYRAFSHASIYIKCCANTMQLSHIHRVLNPTKVGNSFLLLAQISVMLVINAMIYNHQICTPKIKPGTIIDALASHDAASTML